MRPYTIFAFCTNTNDYAYLGEKSASTREEAVHEWERDNPSRSRTLEQTSNIKLVALITDDGI
jgi:hypothetical protein